MQDENPIRNLIRILSKILSRILVRFLLKILNRKMASESDDNLIWNQTSTPSSILVGFLLKILNRQNGFRILSESYWESDQKNAKKTYYTNLFERNNKKPMGLALS
jgi:anaerobic ribonucleoside-triphosphate reductase